MHIIYKNLNNTQKRLIVSLKKNITMMRLKLHLLKIKKLTFLKNHKKKYLGIVITIMLRQYQHYLKLILIYLIILI